MNNLMLLSLAFPGVVQSHPAIAVFHVAVAVRSILYILLSKETWSIFKGGVFFTFIRFIYLLFASHYWKHSPYTFIKVFHLEENIFISRIIEEVFNALSIFNWFFYSFYYMKASEMDSIYNWADDGLEIVTNSWLLGLKSAYLFILC